MNEWKQDTSINCAMSILIVCNTGNNCVLATKSTPHFCLMSQFHMCNITFQCNAFSITIYTIHLCVYNMHIHCCTDLSFNCSLHKIQCTQMKVCSQSIYCMHILIRFSIRRNACASTHLFWKFTPTL